MMPLSYPAMPAAPSSLVSFLKTFLSFFMARIHCNTSLDVWVVVVLEVTDIVFCDRR